MRGSHISLAGCHTDPPYHVRIWIWRCWSSCRLRHHCLPFPKRMQYGTLSPFSWDITSTNKHCSCSARFVLLSNLFLGFQINFLCDCFQVTCEERYSDLEKSIYLPSPNNGKFSKDTEIYESDYKLTNSGEFVRLHPCAQLGPKQVRNQNQRSTLKQYLSLRFRAVVKRVS